MQLPLQGHVAIVTGASRGVGKGIALGLGEAGATVYVSGRTRELDSGARRGSIDETAAAISQLGGEGIAVPCDHRDDGQVATLFERVQAEHGRLDLLVNCATAFPPEGNPLNTPFWELPIAVWDAVHTVGLRSYYVASVSAARLMIAQHAGLIINVSSRGAVDYLFNVPYGAGKAGVDKLTADMAHELRQHGVAVLSIWPGLTRTEEVTAQFRRYGMDETDLAGACDPIFNGRVVAALAADPLVMDKSGHAHSVAALATDFGVTNREAPAQRAE